MAVYLILESVNLGRTLKALGEKSNIFKNFKYALIGFFFSAITPAASGGQPMQIYYMHKDKISVANSTLALLVNLCSFQIITLTFAFISVFLNTIPYRFYNILILGFIVLTSVLLKEFGPMREAELRARRGNVNLTSTFAISSW